MENFPIRGEKNGRFSPFPNELGPPWVFISATQGGGPSPPKSLNPPQASSPPNKKKIRQWKAQFLKKFLCPRPG